MERELRLEALGMLSTAVGVLLEAHVHEALKTGLSPEDYAGRANRIALLAEDIRLLASAMRVFSREASTS